jgi:hypothetical protein
MLEAYVETLRPIVTDIYNEVLSYHFPENSVTHKRTGEAITDYQDLYLYDGDCDSYYKEVQTVLAEKGYPPHRHGHCPLLEAECRLRDIRKSFVSACLDNLPDSIDLTLDSLLHNLKHFKQFLDINMRYVIQFVDTDKLQDTFKPQGD